MRKAIKKGYVITKKFIRKNVAKILKVIDFLLLCLVIYYIYLGGLWMPALWSLPDYPLLFHAQILLFCFIPLIYGLACLIERVDQLIDANNKNTNSKKDKK